MRCQEYQSAILRRVQRPQIDLALGLVYQAQLNEMVTLAQNPQHDYLFRVIDTHDDFTKAHLEELRRRTRWREVGYFPSLFEGMEINTLIAYHSYSYRYLFLPGPDNVP
jgi:hypothetical protein